ncbi:hypothetical protein BC832DRAFT_563206 [Gaertneriomyces semiglobifer]|nr:hypothetical protein BC832DRAFT_563206 [Gaertneriomyces semiglobifer]
MWMVVLVGEVGVDGVRVERRDGFGDGAFELHTDFVQKLADLVGVFKGAHKTESNRRSVFVVLTPYDAAFQDDPPPQDADDKGDIFLQFADALARFGTDPDDACIPRKLDDQHFRTADSLVKDGGVEGLHGGFKGSVRHETIGSQHLIIVRARCSYCCSCCC